MGWRGSPLRLSSGMSHFSFFLSAGQRRPSSSRLWSKQGGHGRGSNIMPGSRDKDRLKEKGRKEKGQSNKFETRKAFICRRDYGVIGRSLSVFRGCVSLALERTEIYVYRVGFSTIWLFGIVPKRDQNLILLRRQKPTGEGKKVVGRISGP